MKERMMIPYIRSAWWFVVGLTIIGFSYTFLVYTDESSVFEQVDRLFADIDSETSPGAAIAIIHEGRVVYSRGYGMANLEYLIPITPSTIFHVASVSKQFTAFAIATLADRGLLSLDDDVRIHMPEFPDFGETITIRHLIHHTSGLRDQWELLAIAGWRLDDVITKEHILKMLRHQRELNFRPGEEYLYSNMGYTVLAEIVERVSGQSFKEWTHENIFEPLGMRNSHFHEDHQHIVPNRAYSYIPGPDNDFRNSVLNYANVGATSLFTTVEDLARWMINFDTLEVGNDRIFSTMHQRGKLNNGEILEYAFALIGQNYRGLGVIGHSGADAGFRSYAGRFPDANFTIIVLSNLATLSPQRMAHRIADLFLHDKFSAPEPALPRRESDRQVPGGSDAPDVLPTRQQLREFTGTYYSDELGTFYLIELRDDKLTATHRRHSDIDLLPAGADRFAGNRFWFQTVEFIRKGDGSIEGFRLSGGRVRNLWFEKQY
jgi:CubicO group peptidase (beta-lactamase class C family)